MRGGASITSAEGAQVCGPRGHPASRARHHLRLAPRPAPPPALVGRPGRLHRRHERRRRKHLQSHRGQTTL